jgi:hypothetical protein
MYRFRRFRGFSRFRVLKVLGSRGSWFSRFAENEFTRRTLRTPNPADLVNPVPREPWTP